MLKDKMDEMGLSEVTKSVLNSEEGQIWIDYIYDLAFDEGFDNGVYWAMNDAPSKEEIDNYDC